jgi:hypothetical protein
MTPRIRFTAFVAFLAAILSLPISNLIAQEIGPPAPADAAPAPAPDGVEVMTRGVIHEAFAEVVTDPKPGLVVSKRPPEAIEEVPPEFKPEEEGAIWISGYWAWDDEREDFFWQSGVWRVPPPGMRWVAGYWNEVAGGWQWVSGFWLPVETEELRYYAAPPASLESGPSSPAPGDNYFWATGSWNYYDTGYRWQPGYWAPYQENWVWISPRYSWTPAGCVYLPGRWDYRLTRRGCLFAPVYFTQPVYLGPSYVYRPWCALNTSNLFVHLWVRPNYCHFYFGNYYGSNWGNWGFTPWCQYRPYRNCYDPMLTQLQCHYRRSGVNYINRLDGWHNHYADNVGSRPPRTWNEQVRVVNNTSINNTNINVTNIKQNVLAVNLKDADRRKDLPMKLARLDGNQHKQAVNLAKETRDVRQQRVSVERPAGLAMDLTKGNGVKRDGNKSDVNKPDLGQRGPRPGTDQPVRLKLPATQVADVVKQKEKTAPPKLSGPKASGGTLTPPWAERDVIESRRGNDRGPMPRPERTGGAPQPKVAVPTELPKVELPKTERPKPNRENPTRQPRIETPRVQPRIEVPQPKVEIPRPQPKLEIPQPKPNRENPVRQPRVEIPRPQPRVEAPRPQPKVEAPRPRVEAPRERPQIKLDIPRPSPRVDAAPRIQPRPAPQPQPQPPRMQPAPRMEVPRGAAPRPEIPRNEPHRGGENKPRGGRGKPE